MLHVQGEASHMLASTLLLNTQDINKAKEQFRWVPVVQDLWIDSPGSLFKM